MSLTSDRRHSLRRSRDAAAGADRDGAEGAGRDRRPADPLACDRDLCGAGVRALPACHRLPGRDGGGVRRRQRLGRTGWRSSASTPASTRRPAGGIARSASGSEVRPSAPPMPTASPTSISTRCSASTASDGGLATMTVVRPHLQWGVAELGDGGRVAGFAEKPRSEHWINGGFFCFEPAALDYLDEDSVLEREPLRAPRRRRRAARLPPRGLLGLHGHLQGRGRAQRPLGRRRGSLARLGREPSGGQLRRVKRRWSPAAHGFVASHLARALLERGDAVRCSTCPTRASPTSADRALRPRPAGLAPRSSWSRPTCATPEAVGVSGRGASSTSVFHLAAQTLVGRRSRSRWRPSRPTCAAPGPASRPAARRGAGGRRRLLRQGLRAEPRASLPRGLPAAAASPYEASKAAADAIARSYAHAYGLPVAVTRFANIYGGGDLNFSRLIPETPSPCSTAGRRRSAPTAAPSATSSTSTTPSPPTWRSSRARRRRRPRARPSTPAASARTRCARWWSRSPPRRTAPVEPEYQGSGNPDGEIDRQYVDSTKLRELTGWRPAVELAEGLRRTLEWYRAHPEARPAKVKA